MILQRTHCWIGNQLLGFDDTRTQGPLQMVQGFAGVLLCQSESGGGIVCPSVLRVRFQELSQEAARMFIFVILYPLGNQYAGDHTVIWSQFVSLRETIDGCR